LFTNTTNTRRRPSNGHLEEEKGRKEREQKDKYLGGAAKLFVHLCSGKATGAS